MLYDVLKTKCSSCHFKNHSMMKGRGSKWFQLTKVEFHLKEKEREAIISGFRLCRRRRRRRRRRRSRHQKLLEVGRNTKLRNSKKTSSIFFWKPQKFLPQKTWKNGFFQFSAMTYSDEKSQVNMLCLKILNALVYCFINTIKGESRTKINRRFLFMVLGVEPGTFCFPIIFFLSKFAAR